MAKRLLTKDFENVVFETFSMPENDISNYYLNTVEEHHSQNPNIIDRLKQELNNWIGWHKSKVYSGTIIEVESEDGTTQNIDLKQSWYIDENGQRVYSNLDETAVSLLPEFGINRQVNRAFFDNQIKILETIQSSIELKQKIEAFEDQLPKFVKESLAEYPQPKGFDFDEINSRVKLLSTIPYVLENLKPKLDQIEKRLTDTPHQITQPIAETLFSSNEYNSFLFQIQANGFYLVNYGNQKIKVYTPELMALFTSIGLTLQNAHTDEKTTLNGRDYLETYAKGFNEGQQHFNSNFAANANTLYGANAEQYVNDIHFNYFHKQHERNKDGWHYYKTSYPLLITHKEISKYGFYAGIISKVEELAAQHPQPFKNFENCQHKTEQPEPQATAKGKQSTKSEFSVLEWATIFYYADATGLLSKERTIIDKIRNFIKEKSIETTDLHFKNQYNEAKNRINKIQNYPIHKLEKITPYLKKHYKQAVTRVLNDIYLLENVKKFPTEY